MSRHVRGKEPACPGAANPWCRKILSDRASVICSGCYNHGRKVTVTATAPIPDLPPAEAVVADRQRTAERAELTSLRARYKSSLDVIDQMEAELTAARLIGGREIAPISIVPSIGTPGTNEATAIIMASDWHSEEIVNPATINYMNDHNIEIHQSRQNRFWEKAVSLVHLIEEGVAVPTIVLALLGDFISNEIHDADSAENNALKPIDAMMMVEDELAGGINFLLTYTEANIIVDCHSGNHARTTHKVRIASESGHSLEHYAYSHLARLFAHEPRVTFRVNEGYHSFMTIYDVKVRLHHGHSVKYSGGIGGITIPVNKAIAQWNKETNVDLDLFGHYHQAFDGGNFVCNGSMIGYNAFAKFIKAGYEPPKQMMLVIDKKHGRTCTWPIYVQPKEMK